MCWVRFLLTLIMRTCSSKYPWCQGSQKKRSSWRKNYCSLSSGDWSGTTKLKQTHMYKNYLDLSSSFSAIKEKELNEIFSFQYHYDPLPLISLRSKAKHEWAEILLISSNYINAILVFINWKFPETSFRQILLNTQLFKFWCLHLLFWFEFKLCERERENR